VYFTKEKSLKGEVMMSYLRLMESIKSFTGCKVFNINKKEGLNPLSYNITSSY